MRKVIVKLSGGNVIEIETPPDVEVEVRQFHRDFMGDVTSWEWDERVGGAYEVESVA